MKKTKKTMKLNLRVIMMVIIIVLMTWFGVAWAEFEWTETASAVIWIIGEVLLVMVLGISGLVSKSIELCRELDLVETEETEEKD